MSGSALRIEMRCILYCDIVQSTPQSVRARQVGEDSTYHERLARFVVVWRTALQHHGAEFVKALGDGLLATSSDPLEIVRGVVETHCEHRADPILAPLGVRAGLHVGTVAVQPDGDIVGADAALGERVMAEARADQVFASEAWASQVRPYLPAGFSLTDVGERILMGFDTPIRIFQLHAPGLVERPVDKAPGKTETRGKARLLLVEDERLLRDALARLLELQPDFELVGQASSGLAGVKQAKELRPDVVLMDIEMPEMDGIEATRLIRESCPDAQVLIITKFGDDDKVFSAIRAGATGYMLKDAGVDEIGPVVRAVYRQEGFLSPALVPRVMKEFSRLARAAPETHALFTELSRREMEVLELLGRGLGNRAISEKLFISEKTTRNHVCNVLAKLHVNDRTEAGLLARDRGLVIT